MDGKRSALILASYHYEDPGLQLLRAPARDAEELARVLRDPEIGGFEVRTVLNQPAHVANLAVEEFFAERRPDDLLVLHFSGHGVKDDSGELYFATADTKLRRLGSTTVSAGFVNRQMSRSRSRRVVLLLDCCYAGAFERGMAPKADQAVHVEDQFGGRGRAVITASGAMEYAFEDAELTATSELRPSVLTRAVVEGLESGDADRDQDGFVGLDELYDYIYDRVHEVTPNQTPGKWTFGIQGELHIARRRGSATRPAALPEGLQQALDQPLGGIRLGAVHELERLLSARHAGLALAARQTLERLRDDDSRAVAAAAAAALDPQPTLPTGAPPRRETSCAAGGTTVSQGIGGAGTGAGRGEARAGPPGGRSRAGEVASPRTPGNHRAPGPPANRATTAATTYPARCHGPRVGRGRHRGHLRRRRRQLPGRDHRRNRRPTIDAWPDPDDTSTEHDQLRCRRRHMEGTKIFEDRFSDKKAGWEWSTTPRTPLATATAPMRSPQKAGDHVAFPRADPELASPNDVAIGVRARRLAGTSGNGYGITFRYKDSQNYYWFNITNKGARSLNKRMNGEWVRLV